MKTIVLLFAGLLIFVANFSMGSAENDTYGYECIGNKCVKVELSSESAAKAISLPVCRLFCGTALGTVWPKPRGRTLREQFVAHINYTNIDFQLPNASAQAKAWLVNKQRFLKLLMVKIPVNDTVKRGGNLLRVQVQDQSSLINNVLPRLTLETDESYQLSITMNNDSEVIAKIFAVNFFGARHGLETLAQLIVYDNLRHEMQMLAKADIQDSPAYKWRGLLLDTSRNFFSVESIKRTLDAMAMVKLNTFHWHITDSQSFPLELKSQPLFHKLGAYSPQKVYRQEHIRDLVEYARHRGIRIIPEFDAPAHVGEGWQHTNMTVCFKSKPWGNHCGEPPCGQLDPTAEGLYDVLEDIYREIFELFEPDVFHMGGDEVSLKCWFSSKRIREWMAAQNWDLAEMDYHRLWGYFQSQALKRVDKVPHGRRTPITLWSSALTDPPYIDDYLNKNRYIIQVWAAATDRSIKEVLKRGFQVIVSNYNALYFDCGGAGWVKGGNNWCSPYIGWQKVYDNSMFKIAGKYDSLVLGAEAAIWSEQIDEFSLDARLWPRASALAEQLWSNPHESWHAAEARLLLHRQRLIESGIRAEAMQPEWCLQNEGDCPINANDPKF